MIHLLFRFEPCYYPLSIPDTPLLPSLLLPAVIYTFYCIYLPSVQQQHLTPFLSLAHTLSLSLLSASPPYSSYTSFLLLLDQHLVLHVETKDIFLYL